MGHAITCYEKWPVKKRCRNRYNHLEITCNYNPNEKVFRENSTPHRTHNSEATISSQLIALLLTNNNLKTILRRWNGSSYILDTVLYYLLIVRND